LQEVGASGLADLVGAVDGGEASLDEEEAHRARLLEQEDGFPGGADASSRARRLDLHKGYEAVDLGFVGGEFGKDAAEPEGIVAEAGADEVVAGGSGVALVED